MEVHLRKVKKKREMEENDNENAWEDTNKFMHLEHVSIILSSSCFFNDVNHDLQGAPTRSLTMLYVYIFLLVLCDLFLLINTFIVPLVSMWAIL